MIKHLILVSFFVVTLFSRSITSSSEDLSVLHKFGIEKSFIYDDELNSQLIYFSSHSKISEYNRNLRRYSKFLPKIKHEFSKKNVPESLIYISMIETGFNNSTGSSSRPAGLWQFMPSTASILGLKVNDYIDERLDIIKSSSVAAKYLLNNNRRFDKWYLAVLAYNCGEGRIIEAVSRVILDEYIEQNPSARNDFRIKNYKNILDKKGKRNYSQLYDIYDSVKYLAPININRLLSLGGKEYLPKSSRIYLRKILALAILSNRGSFYKGDTFSSITSVSIKSGMSLRNVANAIGMSSSHLIEMNKHLKKQIVPRSSSSYHIYIPKEKLEIFNSRKNSIPIVREKETKKQKTKKVAKSNKKSSKKTNKNKKSSKKDKNKKSKKKIKKIKIDKNKKKKKK